MKNKDTFLASLEMIKMKNLDIYYSTPEATRVFSKSGIVTPADATRCLMGNFVAGMDILIYGVCAVAVLSIKENDNAEMD